jgi:hypothetical protein
MRRNQQRHIHSNRRANKESRVGPEHLPIPGGAPLFFNPEVKVPEKVEGLQVAWIQSFERKDGGAELSSSEVIRIGRLLGFNISLGTTAAFHFSVLENADLVILNDLLHYESKLCSQILDYIKENQIPYVVYDHTVFEGAELDTFYSMFLDSILNVFISPLHYMVRLEQFGEILSPYTILPLCVNPDNYYPIKGIQRDENLGVLLIHSPTLNGSLGLSCYIKDHPETSWELYSKGSGQAAKLASATGLILKEAIPHEKVPALLSKAKYLLHYSDNVRANDRVIFEAILCGAIPIMNDSIGAKSWEPIFDIYHVPTLRKVLREAPYLFWRLVMERTLEDSSQIFKWNR